MTEKEFRVYNLVATMIIGFVSSLLFQNELYWLFGLVWILLGLAVWFVQRRVKGVVVDERDRELEARAARYAMWSYSTIGMIVVLVLLSFQSVNPIFETIAMTLLCTLFGFVLVFLCIFLFLKQTTASIVGACVIIGLSLFMLMAFSGIFYTELMGGQDMWGCEDGAWVLIRDGKIDVPMPTETCAQRMPM
ncbi:MAG: DUF2178 domain-containing protein [Patescibacteria group bacterium]